MFADGGGGEVGEPFSPTGPTGAQVPATGQRSQPILDTRVLGKPESFDGSVEKWGDWAFVFRSCVHCVSADLGTLLHEAEGQTEQIPAEMLSPVARQLGTQLCHMLVLLCKDRALRVLQQVESGHGLECWRRLRVLYEPATGNRHVGLLQHILNPSFEGDYLDQLLKWENDVKRYEDSSRERLADSIGTAILLQHSPKDIRVFLQVNASDLKDYQKTRRAVEQYLLAKRSWSRAASSAAAAKDSDAMEVDALTGGKGAGKGNRQKGTKGSKNDSGKDKQGKGQQPKGKFDQQQGKSAGKPAASKLGKGTPSFNGYCSNCGVYGHMARDCWSRRSHVQGLDAEPQGQPSNPPNSTTVAMLSTHDSDEWVMGLALVAPHNGGSHEIDSNASAMLSETCFVGSLSGTATSEPCGAHFMMDSGSMAHVIPPAWAKGLQLVDSDRRLFNVSGGRIKHYGSVVLSVRLIDSVGGEPFFQSESCRRRASLSFSRTVAPVS